MKLSDCDPTGVWPKRGFTVCYPKACRTLQVLSFILLIGVERLRSAEFEIQGIDHLRVPRRGEGDIEKATRFKVAVRECRWLIKVVTEETIEDYVEAGTDGTNTYILTSFVTSSGKEKDVPKWAETASAIILPGSVPKFYLEAHLPILWLAFASSCALSATTNGQLPVLDRIQDPNPFNLRELMPATFRQSKSPPFLAEEVVYFNLGSGAWFSDRTYSPWVFPPKYSARAAPYDRGFTNNVYRVMASTNLGNLWFPVESTCDQFFPRSGGKTNTDLNLVVRHQITVTNIEQRLRYQTLLPTLPGITMANDFRFALSEDPVFGSIRYKFEGHWLNANEVRSLTNFSAQAEEQKRLHMLMAR